MYGFIYITTNLINNKKYLGFCSYAKKTWKTYIGSGKFLRKAIKKYGRKNFTREIICECRTKEELSQKEIEFITIYDCVNSRDWYNIAKGGYATRGFLGKKHSIETRKKMQINHKQPLTDDSRKRIGEATRIRRLGKKTWSKSGASNIKSVSVVINGKIYPTITSAHKETGISYYNVRKLAGLDKPHKIKGFIEVCVDNIKYRSIRQAMLATGLSRYIIKQHHLIISDHGI